MEIREHSGPRGELRELFALAEDAPERLAAYLGRGRVLVAVDDGRVVGHVQLVDAPGGVELLTLAVAEDRRGEGIGRALVERRMLRVERDAFTVADGYPAGLEIEGIPLRDRIWLSLDL